MLRVFGAALLLTSALAFAADPASALQLVVTKVQKNANHTTTYHFALQTDPGETLTPGEDFVTVYNFAGLVHGTVKSPEGWTVTSAEFGKTPTWEGYPAVMPVDIPDLSNLTWEPGAPVAGGTEITGFSATTRAGGTTNGEYTAQVTRDEPGVDGTSSQASKQALIGEIATPRFLAK